MICPEWLYIRYHNIKIYKANALKKKRQKYTSSSKDQVVRKKSRCKELGNYN